MPTHVHPLRSVRRPAARTALRPRLREQAEQHPATAFFLLGFSLSWLLWTAPALGLRGPAGSLLLVAGIFGPAVAAATITRLTGGSLRAWLRELVRFRAPARWYAAILAFPVLVVGTTVGLFALTGGALDTGLLGERLLAYLPLLLVWTLAGAGEEPGWRGFALPRLLERTTPVRATLLLGFLWALWHLPLLAAADEPSHGLSALPLVGVTLLMLVAIVGYAFFYTYLWARTRNVWLAILLHGSLTAAIATFVLVPMDDQMGGTYAHLQVLTVVVVAAAVTALVLATRGRLGLERDRPPSAGRSPRLPLAGVVALLALTVAGLPAAAGAAERPVGATTTERIDRFVEEQLEARAVPGFALAIVRDGEVLHARGFGSADGAGTPVTPDTPFVLGSVSKSFTALAVMQLVDAGKVALDAPIARYVPELRLAGGAERRITVRHLLNQTSGIPGQAGGSLLRSVGDGTFLDVVQELEGSATAAVPGARFEYANANWVLLGLVVERASGEPYGEYVRRHVFEPLGMRASFADPAAARASGLAVGHRFWFGVRVSHGPTSPDAVRPSGYLMSSAADMARYLTMILNGGELDGRRLVSREGLELLLRPEAAAHLGPWADGQESRYSMGWFVGGPWEEPALLHPGRAPDSAAMAVLLPRQGLGVVTLANANHELPLPGAASSLNRIPSGVVSLLVGEEPAPGPSLLRFYALFDAAVALFSAALALAFVRLLRARGPATARRRVGALARAAVETALGGLLLALPALSGQGYEGALLWWPDLTAVVLVGGAALVALGILRVALRVRTQAPARPVAVVRGRPAAPPPSRAPRGPDRRPRRPPARTRVRS